MKRPSRITVSSTMCGGASSGCQHDPSLRNKSMRLLRFQPYWVIGVTLSLISCQDTGNAPKLQGHLQGAKNASSDTAQHIGKTRNSIERIDYKAGRARKLLDEGFSK